MSCKTNNLKKGQISIGAMLAIVIFINLVIFSFIIINDIFEPKKIMEQSMKRDAKNVITAFKENLTITVYKVPVFITSSDNYTNARIDILFQFPGGADPNSLSLLTSSDKVILYDYDFSSGELVWYSDLTVSNTNKFFIVYVTNTTLSKWDFESLYVNTTPSEDDIYNSKVKLLFDFNGINELLYLHPRVNATFDEIPLINSIIFDSPPVQFNLTNTTLFGFARYPDANVTVIGDTAAIIIDNLKEDNITFNLVDYDNIYNTTHGGSTMVVFYNGLPANDTLNTSIAVIGNMNYTLTNNNNTLEVESSSIEIYPFAGNCSLAEPRLKAYNATYTYIIGVAESSTGLFEEKYSILSGMSVNELKATFNITGDFFIYFRNITGSLLAG